MYEFDPEVLEHIEREGPWVERAVTEYPKVTTTLFRLGMTPHLRNNTSFNVAVEHLLECFQEGSLDPITIAENWGLVVTLLQAITMDKELDMPAEIIILVAQASAEVKEKTQLDPKRLARFKRNMNRLITEMGENDDEFLQWELPFVDLSHLNTNDKEAF
jgi:type III secretory pathway component EscS